MELFWFTTGVLELTLVSLRGKVVWRSFVVKGTISTEAKPGIFQKEPDYLGGHSDKNLKYNHQSVRLNSQ